MALTDEQKKNWQMFDMLLIGVGLSINFYLLYKNDDKTVSSTIMRSGMNAIVTGIGRQ